MLSFKDAPLEGERAAEADVVRVPPQQPVEEEHPVAPAAQPDPPAAAPLRPFEEAQAAPTLSFKPAANPAPPQEPAEETRTGPAVNRADTVTTAAPPVRVEQQQPQPEVVANNLERPAQEPAPTPTTAPAPMARPVESAAIVPGLAPVAVVAPKADHAAPAPPACHPAPEPALVFGPPQVPQAQPAPGLVFAPAAGMAPDAVGVAKGNMAIDVEVCEDHSPALCTLVALRLKRSPRNPAVSLLVGMPSLFACVLSCEFLACGAITESACASSPITPSRLAHVMMSYLRPSHEFCVHMGCTNSTLHSPPQNIPFPDVDFEDADLKLWMRTRR